MLCYPLHLIWDISPESYFPLNAVLACILPYERLISFSSVITVLYQEVFSLPLSIPNWGLSHSNFRYSFIGYIFLNFKGYIPTACPIQFFTIDFVLDITDLCEHQLSTLILLVVLVLRLCYLGFQIWCWLRTHLFLLRRND